SIAVARAAESVAALERADAVGRTAVVSADISGQSGGWAGREGAVILGLKVHSTPRRWLSGWKWGNGEILWNGVEMVKYLP
ncbi:hypothetical protein THAOC_21911, partial [Thalassiosira oceanica]